MKPWAIMFAAGPEPAMGFTPRPATFGFRVTDTFVVVTLTAQLIFGITLGLMSIGLEKRMARC